MSADRLSPERETEIRDLLFKTGLNAACEHFDTPVERDLYRLAALQYNARLEVHAELDRVRTELETAVQDCDSLVAERSRVRGKLAARPAEAHVLRRAAVELDEQGHPAAAESLYVMANQAEHAAGARPWRTAEEKATPSGASVTPQLDDRLGRLADHILNTGGEWTTSRAHRWLLAEVDPGVSRHRARHALQHLTALGYLTEHDRAGRRSYTPNYAKADA